MVIQEIISDIMAKKQFIARGYGKDTRRKSNDRRAVAEREEETRLRQYFAAVRKVRRYAKRIIRDWMMNFGENFKNIRKQCGLSQQEVADKLQIKQSSVSDWENDVSRPDYEKLIALSELYDVTLYELLGIDWTENCKKPRSRLFYF